MYLQTNQSVCLFKRSKTMNGLIEIFQGNPMALVFGGFGLICQLIWPLFGERKAILSVQLGIGTNYGVQYALLDAWSGAGIALLGATQTVIALLAGDKPWLKKMGLAFLPLVGVVAFITWSGLPSLLSLTACSLVMLGRLQNDTLLLRVFLLAAAPFGIGYDVSVGAGVALCGAISSAVIALTMLVGEFRARRRAQEKGDNMGIAEFAAP
jgi:hypothetical protein